MKRKLMTGGATLVLASAVLVPLSLASAHTYASCPANDRHQLTSATGGAGQTMVPGRPGQVLLCRYSGVNPDPAKGSRLLQHRLIVAVQTVSQLAARFDALRPFGSGTYSCPADFGIKIIAFFRYSSQTGDDPVTLDPNGCTAVTNGRITRTAMYAPGPALVSQLHRLVG